MLVKVKLAFLFAVTAANPDGTASEPDPVQPLTVKALPRKLLPVKLATRMPLKLSVKLAPEPVRIVSLSV